MSRKHKRVVARIIIAASLTLAAWLLPLTGPLRLGAFLLPYLLIGYDVLGASCSHILRGQIFDEQFLMSIATLGALALGEYPEAAGVMIFYQVGELFQSLAVGKSRRSIAALMDIRPDYAVALRDGQELRLSPEQVAMGEMIIIRPGERVPLDGVVRAGRSAVNTAALTGESLPEDKAVGDRVLSGSVNLDGVIEVETTSVYQDSAVARILELTENAAGNKARAEAFITRFARYYTPCVVGAATLLALLPPLALGLDWAMWIERALIFLMVSCPCALVVSVPLTFFGGLGGASRRGVLVKGANYLEALATADTVVMDKTGTLTQGSLAVAAVHGEGIEDEALLEIAALAEAYSSHPMAVAISRAWGQEIDKSRVNAVSELAGMGVRVQIDGKTTYAGNGRLMEMAGVKWTEEAGAGAVVHVAQDGVYLGRVIISDQLKPSAAPALRQLKALGVKRIVMLTGDRKEAAAAIGCQLAVDEIHAGLLPEDKVAKVEELLAAGARLAFVGDGVNDAPVLARADVGIAMGALGSDAAIEAADVVLMDDDPLKLALAISIARKTMAIARQNIWFALSVKGAILLLSAAGLASMWAAVFGDVGVMVLAILNALRAMKSGE